MDTGKVMVHNKLYLCLLKVWKGLDNKCFEIAILMNLSKAFGSLNYELLIANLHAYGFDESS